MGTTTRVAFRALGVSAAAFFLATCTPDRGTLEPDTRANLPQTAGAAVRVARVIEPLELEVPYPAGLAYTPGARTLLVVSGAPPASTTDIELVTLFGNRAGTVRITAALTDPLNLAYDGHANRLLILESSTRQFIEILARADGSLDPQTLRRIDARGLGVEDPRGLTIDPASGQLFILDAAGPRVVRVEPQARFDVASPVVAEIDLAGRGLSELRGLAFDPSSGHLHVLDPVTQALYELSETGEIVATRDLSEFDFRNPQGMTFGPSGDTTDDPSEMSLYLADSGVGGGGVVGAGSTFAESGRIIELSFEQPVAPRAGLFATEGASLVQHIDTWRFNPPSPDPAGITYLPFANHLLISDSEVNEMGIFEDVNLFQITLSGNLRETGNTLIFGNDEPTGVTYDPANQHIFVSMDDGDAVFEVDRGPDGLYGTNDDMVTSFSTGSFGSGDPEGVTYDFSQNVLYIVDGLNREVYRVSPGSNGLFDGIDDDVTHFDTRGFGLEDPEGIAYDSDYGHLYIVGKPATRVFHVTTTGTLLRQIDISAANASKPAGLAYAPGSANPGQMSLYIVDRNVDNNTTPSENDGELYEVSFARWSGNALPAVTITQPPPLSMFLEGDVIAFEGTGTDFEDGDLTANLTWNSNRDGPIGSGRSFSISTLSIGTHTITANVTDSGGSEVSARIMLTVNCRGCFATEVRVATSFDDAEESATGKVNLTSGDLELIQAGSDQTVGMRFNGIAIPSGGVTVTNAYIQFQVDEVNSDATSLTIQGEATDNALTFSSANGGISSRGRTVAAVSWSPAPWTTVGDAGEDQRTPDIASVVQEIVDRPGWSSGNALAMIITGTGKRVAESYDGVPGAAPLLHVDYLAGSSNAPTASFTWTAADLAVDFTDTSSDPDGMVTGWNWNFGDGGTSTLQNPSHTYGAAGSYTVTLTVTDNDGATSTASTQTVTVTAPPPPPNQAPTASFSWSAADLAVDFTDASSDPDGSVIGWNWNFGDSNTSTVQNPSHTYGAAGSYTVTLTVTDNDGATSTASTQSVTVTAPMTTGDMIYVTSPGGGTVGGVSFDDEDILAYDPDTDSWSLYFDGSDVGLGDSSDRDVRAFALLANGDILLRLNHATVLPDVGSVEPSDILRFSGSTGLNTSGTFSLYFRGADVGLAGEEIDAISFAPDGRLVISTEGAFSVPGASGRDEDLIALDAGGATWSMYFDGSDVGLSDASSEDVAGVSIDATTGDIFLSTKGAFSVAGVSGSSSTIFVCRPSALGSATSCSFAPYWAGSAHGLTSNVVIGIHIGSP